MNAIEFIENKGLVINEHRMLELMTQFAKLKCAEQREICSKEVCYNDNGETISTDSILYAPEPNFS